MTGQRKIFIDCGVNMGTGFSKLCNTVGVDENWEIFGFEPNEYAFDIYVEHIKSEKYSFLSNKNFNLFQKAVWIEDGEIEFCMEGLSEKEYNENEHWKEEIRKHRINYPLDRLELGVPSSGGSCIKKLHEKHQRAESHEKLYEWSDPVLVECIDFSKWIKDNFSKEDYIFLKMDIEGSEYKILPKMINDGTISYIDALVIEWHDWIMPEFKSDTLQLQQQLQNLGINVLPWG
jgi:FkbM family methyltransferase